MPSVERSIRLSQIVTSFGVGAVYDILGESLVLCDIGSWHKVPFWGRGREIKAERLVLNLNAAGYKVLNLYEPAKTASLFGASGNKLPYMRFPRWLFCSKCRRMKKWTFQDERNGESPACAHCGRNHKLSPMRFIMICADGHMSDVPWQRWAHSKITHEDQLTCASEDLEFRTGATKSGGLESVAVKCRQCGASRHLGGITSPSAMKAVGVKCTGKQPWQAIDHAEDCKREVHVVQRGAGNVYYPRVKSAITIPPESFFNTAHTDLGEKIRDNPNFKLLLSSKGNPAFNTMEAFLIPRIVEDVHCSEADVRKEITRGDEAQSQEEVDIESEEWMALAEPLPEQDDRDMFVTKHISLKADGLGALAGQLSLQISRVVSVVKLREVRALTGFFRYHPGGSEQDGEVNESRPVRPDVGKNVKWVPATEVFGEGIFLTLDENKLQEWEQDESVKRRVMALARRSADSTFGALLPKKASPRYVLLHTIAHLLIRRLAFECGYSSASLRERIYCWDTSTPIPRAGMLIYTAAGDAEGTLGGLARQAEATRLTATLLSSLQDAACCSADPICLESQAQGSAGLNLAACHACSLVAETSCEAYNLLLDRALVIGGEGVRGFFEKELSAALELSLTFNSNSEAV